MTAPGGRSGDDPRRLISALPLLARLDDESRRSLARCAHVREVPAGATIFVQGDAADALYVVVEGELRVVVTAPSGDEATIATIHPGESCGELGLFDGRPRSASVVAARPCRLLAVARADFVDWLRQRPDAALALLEALSVRIRRVNDTLADFAFLELPQRLAKRLLDIAAPSGTDPGPIRVTQAELASMLGVSRESVNKELNALARAGWIVLGRGSVRVVDAAALQRFTAAG